MTGKQELVSETGISLYPAFKYEGYAWGMTIDLDLCYTPATELAALIAAFCAFSGAELNGAPSHTSVSTLRFSLRNSYSPMLARR